MTATQAPTGYALLFGVRSYRLLLASALVARVPMGMRALGVLVMVVSATDSYLVAGAASGLSTAAQALVAPRWAHCVRRHGVARVIWASAPVTVLFTVLLIVGARGGLDAWALVVLAGLSGGFVLPLGAINRGMWNEVLEARTRDTAYALEGVFDEVAYVAGPALVVTLEYAAGPGVGLLTATGLYLAGTAAMAVKVGQVHPHDPTPPARVSTASVLRAPGIGVVVGAYFLVGAFFGALDVGIVARAQSVGHGAAAGWLLSVLGATSAVAGLLYGAVRWRVSVRIRMFASTLLLALLLVPLLFTADLAWTVVWLAAAGVCVSPLLISANGVVATGLGDARAVLGLAMLSSSITVGMGAGTFIGGLAAEQHSPDRAVALAVALVGVAALTQAPVLRGHRP